MSKNKAVASLNGRRTLMVSVAIGVVIVLAVVVIGRAGPDGSDLGSQPTCVVERGPLTISVTESGTIQARDQVILKSEVEGQTTIIYLVPEGTLVEEGQLLVQLDSSNLEDQKVDQQIRVQNAEAAFIRARENLEVVKSQGTSDVARAQLDYQFAQEDLSQYLDGEYPKQLKEADSKITLAKEEFQRADEKLKWSQKLYEEKYISQTELEADQLTANRSDLDHQLAVTSRDLLTNFTYERQVAEMRSNIDQTKMALDRVQRKAKADVIQAEADLKAKEAEFHQQQDRLDKIGVQITKTKIYAPISGMVVYATSARGSWRGNSEPLDEGQSVRERQELIYLPTATSMMAEVKVHESSLDKIRKDLPVRITVDALPGKSFTGRVAKIAPLPDAQSMWLNPDLKVFSTQIYLDGSGEGLRTGMSCRAEILVDRYEDAVYVPVQAVLRVAGQPTAYVKTGEEVVARPVEIGLNNNLYVRVISGLEGGEHVLLAPPLAEATVAEAAEENSFGQVNAAQIPRESSAQPPARTETAGDDQTAPGSEDERRRPRREGRMSTEQREQMRQQFENMSPEDREKMREQFQQRRRQNQDGSDSRNRRQREQ